MKNLKILLLLIPLLALACFSYSQTAAASGVLRTVVKDTVVNAASATHDFVLTGAKTSVSFQVNTAKISGTIAGTIKVFGSVDGTNFTTTALTSVALVDATQVYAITYAGNYFQKYRVVVATTGTSSMSEQTYLMYRPK
jgi:hypothetical protein